MLDRSSPARLRLELQAQQRKRFRRAEIAHAMLVVDRERFARLAGERRRTAAHIDDLLPAPGGFVVLTRTPRCDRKSSQCLGPDGIEHARRRARHLDRSREGGPRGIVHSRARVRPPERNRFARGVDRCRAEPDDVQQP